LFSPEVAPYTLETLPDPLQRIASGLRLYSDLTRVSVAVLEVSGVVDTAVEMDRCPRILLLSPRHETVLDKPSTLWQTNTMRS
jgi:hypothetical protein